MKLIIGGVVLAILIIIITIIAVKVGLKLLREHTHKELIGSLKLGNVLFS